MDESPLKNIGKVGGVALEIWTMDSNYYFDNILIDNDPSVAEEYREQFWAPKQEAEVIFLQNLSILSHVSLTQEKQGFPVKHDKWKFFTVTEV